MSSCINTKKPVELKAAAAQSAVSQLPHVKCRSTNPAELLKVEKSRGGKKGGKDGKDDSNFILRPYIPNEYVTWAKDYKEYTPVEFTSDKVIEASKDGKYDPIDAHTIKYFNKEDPIVRLDRRSGNGEYKLNKDGRPVNVVGRTGISGRGHLGRWGPNQAADPIVTRWKKDAQGKNVVGSSGKPILQFVAIQRKDNGEWAIPGGMVDPGEKFIKETLIREFKEEATGSLEKAKAGAKANEKDPLDVFFSEAGVHIYKGYVDDPRNTDNAWMETTAYNFHDKTGIFEKINLNAGSDAEKAKWMDIDGKLSLYASHKDFIKKTVDLHNAHW